MKCSKLITGIIVACVLTAGQNQLSAANDTMGLVVHKFRNSYFLRRARRADVKIAVRVQDMIRSGDILRTIRRSRLTLQMRNGSIYHIAPQTLVRVDSLGRKGKSTRLKIKRGSVYIRVEKRRGYHLEIETPTAVASVRGTDVIVDVKKKKGIIETKIRVLNGAVEVTELTSGRMLIVDDGQKATLQDGKIHKQNMEGGERRDFNRFEEMEEYREPQIAQLIEQQEKAEQKEKGETAAKPEPETVAPATEERGYADILSEAPIVEPLDLNTASPYK